MRNTRVIRVGTGIILSLTLAIATVNVAYAYWTVKLDSDWEINISNSATLIVTGLPEPELIPYDLMELNAQSSGSNAEAESGGSNESSTEDASQASSGDTDSGSGSAESAGSGAD